MAQAFNLICSASAGGVSVLADPDNGVILSKDGSGKPAAVFLSFRGDCYKLY